MTGSVRMRRAGRRAFLTLLLVPSIVILLPGTSLATEPATTGAYAGNEICADCHEESFWHDSIHQRIRSFEIQGATVGCEGCHGPGEAHAEEGDPELIRRFGFGMDSNGACLSCHARKAIYEWPASVHAAENVACTDCHSVHSVSAPEETCATCHGGVVAQFHLPSRHPVLEGKMNCSSCHNVHASNDAMLAGNALRTNDLCFTCHQDKEGPFIFEHAPVQEDCSTCHVAHGTVANNLLTANEPALCLQCHDFHFHSGYRSSDLAEVDVGGIERENPFGARGFNIAMTTSCTQCHSRVHGSDTPSQTVPGQGKGKTH